MTMKTVAAMDVLVPGVGEIIGGSQREERLAVLDERMDPRLADELWWYRTCDATAQCPTRDSG